MTGLLDGLLVIDMAQFLSGPSAALRLGDLGARVIKIERPVSGDIGRTLYLSDTEIDGDSTLFHSINRNKESFAADYKDPADLARVKALLARADVVIQNFRPGVAERLGLGAETLRKEFPRLVVGTISGYGEEGEWREFPGQDLLAQALSGVTWLSGSASDGPVPIGLSVGDMLAGHILVEGILAALVRRGITGEGAHIATSLLEALVDFQFEVITTHLNDGNKTPQRAAHNNAHAYLAAPYGLYATKDSYLALAMTPLTKLEPLLGISLVAVGDHRGFAHRDAVKALIAERLAEQTTQEWLDILRPHDIWCAPVLDWPELLRSESFKRLGLLQTLEGGLQTTRTPARVDGQRAQTQNRAPHVGQHTAAIIEEFGLETDNRG